jgi:multicomponent Na+:H+ antiporter subunit D
MVGAFAISAVPLFSGFVSKSMVVSAAAETHKTWIFLMLTLASSGTFLHTGLKLPYYMFFASDRGLRAAEPPRNMLAAMALAGAACLVIGIVPGVLYAHLPYEAGYHAYTARHVISTMGLLGFTAVGFFLLLRHLDPEPSISLDTDWFYRRGLPLTLGVVEGALARLEGLAGQVYELTMRRMVLGAAALLRELDAQVIDATAVGVGQLTQAMSQSLRATVSGHAQYYALIMAAGVLGAIALAVFSQ